MPRQARLNAPDTLHHVMVRGIERTAIFRDDRDRADFVARLARVAEAGAPPSRGAASAGAWVAGPPWRPSAGGGRPPRAMSASGGAPPSWTSSGRRSRLRARRRAAPSPPWSRASASTWGSRRPPSRGAGAPRPSAAPGPGSPTSGWAASAPVLGLHPAVVYQAARRGATQAREWERLLGKIHKTT
jgi:hypothetical protein